MADHSTEIERIQTILASGAKSIDVDGTRTQIDHAALRSRLRELQAQDDVHRGKRPVVSRINCRDL